MDDSYYAEFQTLSDTIGKYVDAHKVVKETSVPGKIFYVPTICLPYDTRDTPEALTNNESLLMASAHFDEISSVVCKPVKCIDAREAQASDLLSSKESYAGRHFENVYEHFRSLSFTTQKTSTVKTENIFQHASRPRKDIRTMALPSRWKMCDAMTRNPSVTPEQLK